MTPASTISRLREDVERVRRRVVDRGHAVGEVRDVFPLGFRERLEAGVVQVRVRVDEPRASIVLPFASNSRAPAGAAAEPAGPIAAIRFPVTTTSTLSSISSRPAASRFIVRTRAPRSTNDPCGAGRGIVSVIWIC